MDLQDISESTRTVELVSCTPHAENLVIYVARVSSPNNQTNFDTGAKLLKYLIDNHHWSPLEHPSLTVQIKTTTSISMQLLRHRSFVFQQFSQRYAKATSMIKYEARRQDSKNRQNSIDDMSTEDKEWFSSAQDKVWKTSNELYNEALNKGIAKEQARFLLPQNVETTLYMTGNLRSWIHYLQLRTGHGTQKEHKDIADEIKKIFIKEFPIISEAAGWTVS